MDFGDILEQWDQQTQKPTGKKKCQAALKATHAKQADHKSTSTKSLEWWLRRHDVVDKDAELEAEYLNKPHLSKKVIAKMPVEATIDLHGLTVEEAQFNLDIFFREAIERKYKKIVIIHGKGKHSKDGAILAPFVKNYLEHHPHAGRSAFLNAKDGGTGSRWVLLKNP